MAKSKADPKPSAKAVRDKKTMRRVKRESGRERRKALRKKQEKRERRTKGSKHRDRPKTGPEKSRRMMKMSSTNKYALAMQRAMGLLDTTATADAVGPAGPRRRLKRKRPAASDLLDRLRDARRRANDPAAAAAAAAAAASASKVPPKTPAAPAAPALPASKQASAPRAAPKPATEPFHHHDDDAASELSDDSLWNEIRPSKAPPAAKQAEAPPAKRQRVREGAEPAVAAPQPPTLFVRNVPVMAEEHQLRERFERFGPVKRVLIVTDRVTGAPKGSAFIHFGTEEALTACLTEAKRDAEWRQMVNGKGEQAAAKGTAMMPPSRRTAKRDHFRQETVEVADLERPAITWQGYRLLVDRAVAKEEAAKFTRAVKTKAEKKDDSRNLKFAREGRIRPGTPAAQGVDPFVLELMEARYAEKKRKLKNPNFVVSPTRLCVHHIPPDVDEKELRSIFLGAVKEYIAKHGDPCGDWDQRPADRKGRRKGEDPTIRQVKVVVDKGRGSKSSGFGFVHFKFHEHALVALREVNNNPHIFGPARRLYVEFAVDNMQKLRLLQTKHDRWQSKLQQKSAAKASGAPGNPAEGAEPEDAPTRPKYATAKSSMPYKDYKRIKKKMDSKKKGQPAYMRTQAYQDMVVAWIRRKKMLGGGGGGQRPA